MVQGLGFRVFRVFVVLGLGLFRVSGLGLFRVPFC